MFESNWADEIDRTHAEGGTLITHMPAVIYTGQHLQAKAKPSDGDEFQKQMVSTLRAAPPYILFDNLSGDVDNGVLAMAITSRKYGGRELGFSRNAKVEVVGSFIYTGVGIRFSKELHRRNVPIRLNANNPLPGERKFKYEFDTFLKANRGRLDLVMPRARPELDTAGQATERRAHGVVRSLGGRHGGASWRQPASAASCRTWRTTPSTGWRHAPATRPWPRR